MATVETHPPPLLLAGPTAVGKSDVALLLAERLGGEIISVDSMQVYRGLDLGTAKPGAAERLRVPHHLLDVAELTEPFDAAQFVALASRAVEDIQRRGKQPILCGGTGLYFKAFLDGLGEAPPGEAVLRAALEGTPLPDLLIELAARDPATFAAIDQKNARRVVRALEVIRLTGKPFSQQRAPWPAPRTTSHAPRFIVLRRAPGDLRSRIDARVEAMFTQGLVEETRRLLPRGLAESRTALQAIGYRQVVEHLRGERPLPATIELIKVRTRQFAKRQMTWFRRQMTATWLDIQPSETAPSIANRVISSATAGP